MWHSRSYAKQRPGRVDPRGIIRVTIWVTDHKEDWQIGVESVVLRSGGK